MFEFLIATGKFGVIGITLVFYLAKPGSEISFWGIKFYKKAKSSKAKKIPRNIPSEWNHVFQVFIEKDDELISPSLLFKELAKNNKYSRIKAQGICIAMAECDLIDIFDLDFYSLKDEGYKRLGACT
ncbi:MAG: hypothetical protein ACI82Z_000723 [Cellvibrionaceae bacterium]|jgi:hypothetical protein